MDGPIFLGLIDIEENVHPVNVETCPMVCLDEWELFIAVMGKAVCDQ